MSRQRFYITTAIPYVNGDPHIGFALECVQADVLARHRRLRGDDVRFLSGTDDNSLKNVQAAVAAGLPLAEFVNAKAARFAALRDPLALSYDDFIRTSVDPRHQPGVERLWRACAAAGDLYERDYEGLYCVGCEAFVSPDELVDGLCPEHAVPPEHVAERNWFFRLSRYQDELRLLIESGRLRVEPEHRRNEALSFIASGLADFSVSRSRERVQGWGIPVPGDASQVIYVWFDALANYPTALSGDGARAPAVPTRGGHTHRAGPRTTRCRARPQVVPEGVGSESGRRQAARAVERRASTGEGRQTHDGSRMRGIDEAALSHVHADVVQSVEEHEIAGREPRIPHATAVAVLGHRVVRQPDTQPPVDVHHEPRAVEALPRAGAAPGVVDAEVAESEARRANAQWRLSRRLRAPMRVFAVWLLVRLLVRRDDTPVGRMRQPRGTGACNWKELQRERNDKGDACDHLSHQGRSGRRPAGGLSRRRRSTRSPRMAAVLAPEAQLTSARVGGRDEPPHDPYG
jgi:tRNA synthetases class I (M)